MRLLSPIGLSDSRITSAEPIYFAIILKNSPEIRGILDETTLRVKSIDNVTEG